MSRLVSFNVFRTICFGLLIVLNLFGGLFFYLKLQVRSWMDGVGKHA